MIDPGEALCALLKLPFFHILSPGINSDPENDRHQIAH